MMLKNSEDYIATTYRPVNFHHKTESLWVEGLWEVESHRPPVSRSGV